MRYILLIYQNTEAWNELSQEDKDVCMHVAGDIVENLSATASGSAARAWPTPRRHGRRACATASSWLPTGPFSRPRRRSPATVSSTSPPRNAPRRSRRAGPTPSTGAWKSAR